MGFAVQTHRMTYISSYADCVEHTRRTVPWRGTEEYPLCGRSKRHMYLHQWADGSWACRLYRTDVVVYHPDGEVTVEPWASQSTIEFARRVLPNGMVPDFLSRLGHLLRCGGRVYNLPDGGARFRDIGGGAPFFQWRPVTPTLPITLVNLDRKAAREVCRAHKLHEFLNWQRAALTLKPRQRYDHTVYASQIPRLLADPARWVELRTTGASTIRKALYRAADCFTTTHAPWLEASEYAGALARDRRYN